MRTPNNETRGSRSRKLSGIVLRHLKFGESHKTIVVLSENEGKIRFSAFGSLTENSRRRIALQTGNYIQGSAYIHPVTEALSIKEAEVIDNFLSVKSDLKKMSFFFLLLEILDKVLPAEHSIKSFDALLDVIHYLGSSVRFEKYFFHYIITFLSEEGIFPEYSPTLPNELRNVIPPDFSIGSGSLRFIRDCLSSKNMSFWDDREISLSVIENLMNLMSYVVTSHCGKKLNSLSLIRFR